MDAALVDWAVSRWGTDPFSLGSWSHLRPGASPADRRTLGRPFGRLVIAGEATHPTKNAMTHGAFEEGRRAARWCLGEGAERVVVVGAGFAGIGAARALHDAGVEVIVLEGRDRIGGRVHTVDVGGVRADVGASWLQHEASNGLLALARSLGLRAVRTDFADPLVRTAAGPLSRPTPAIVAGLARAAGSAAPDRSLAAHLAPVLARLGPLDAREALLAIEAEIVIESGIALDDLSALHWFGEPGTGHGDHWLPGGYGELVDHLARDLAIVTSRRVESVEQHPDAVTVCWAGGATAATHGVVTVPLPVLGTLGFDPPLPEAHRGALAGLGTGTVEKVVLAFHERFWPTSTTGYLRWLDPVRPSFVEWLDLTDTVGVPVVAGLIAHPHLDRLWREQDDAGIARAAAGELVRFATA